MFNAPWKAWYTCLLAGVVYVPIAHVVSGPPLGSDGEEDFPFCIQERYTLANTLRVLLLRNFLERLTPSGTEQDLSLKH